MQAEALVRDLGVRVVRGGDVRICDITDDSRTVLPGSLFIARRGTISDGRRFIADAASAGAAAILTDDPAVQAPPGVALLVAADVPRAAAAIAERFYGDPSSRLTLIGITGTNGKTTTAHLVHHILNGAGIRCGLIGTVVVDDGVETAPATLTTPPATELSRTLGVMVEAGCRAAVMEVSSHALHQGRVAALRFDVAVFTNLTGDHLDYHGTMDDYAAAKAGLFERLSPDGRAIVNGADPWAARMLRDCRAGLLRCATGAATPPVECRAEVSALTMAGTEARFIGPWGQFEARTRLVGPHNAMNALQALAACFAAGASVDDLRHGIEHAAPPPGRLEPVTGPADPFAVLVDYAHTDDALRKVLAAVRPMVQPPARLIVVFGCGGDRDRTKRPRMAAAAVELADRVIITSDNPRTEDPRAIIGEIVEGVPADDRPRVAVDPDRRRAITLAVDEARAGDLIVIAGKGHETYQILPDGRGGTVRTHFDDRQVARDALAARRAAGTMPRAPAPAAASPARPRDARTAPARTAARA